MSADLLTDLVPLERGPAGEHPLAGGALVQPGGEVGVLQVDLHGGLGREVLRADRARVLHNHLKTGYKVIIILKFVS